MDYPKDQQANIDFRIKIIDEAENDPRLQQALMAECEANPLFFFNCFAWTYNPKIEPFDFPFVTYPFQDRFIIDLVRCIENEEDAITEKSREMGFSWMLVGLHLWGLIFKKWASLYGSHKEDYVDSSGSMDSFFERAGYMLSYLPKWMKPKDLVQTYMTITSKSLGASISGDSGQNFGTGGRRKFVTLDEFQAWQFAEKAFRKTRDVSSCRIFGGTPEGRFNIYGKIMTGHPDYKHLRIKKFRLHWSEHPLKTQDWYENEKRNRTKLDIAKELDISYDESVTGAVYKDFTKIAQFGRYEFDPNLYLYTSWDFGRDTNAIIWVQHEVKTDTHTIIDSFQKVDVDIEFMTAFISGVPFHGYEYTESELEKINLHSFWKHKYAGHFGDPYNAMSKTTNAKNSISDILKQHGINIITQRESSVEDRINKATLFMKKLRVDDRNTEFIQAIVQSRYPQTSENSQATSEKSKPIHDANSHFRTAYEYYVDNCPKAVEKVDIERLNELREKTRGSYYGSNLNRRLTNSRETITFRQ